MSADNESGDYRRVPVCGPELPLDPFERACAAVYRSLEPYSLRITIDTVSGERIVEEVVPYPRSDLRFLGIELGIARLYDGRRFEDLRLPAVFIPRGRGLLGPLVGRSHFRRGNFPGGRGCGGRDHASVEDLRRFFERMRCPGRSRNE